LLCVLQVYRDACEQGNKAASHMPFSALWLYNSREVVCLWLFLANYTRVALMVSHLLCCAGPLRTTMRLGGACVDNVATPRVAVCNMCCSPSCFSSSMGGSLSLYSARAAQCASSGAHMYYSPSCLLSSMGGSLFVQCPSGTCASSGAHHVL
jgi:hypothetical protein